MGLNVGQKVEIYEDVSMLIKARIKSDDLINYSSDSKHIDCSFRPSMSPGEIGGDVPYGNRKGGSQFFSYLQHYIFKWDSKKHFSA